MDSEAKIAVLLLDDSRSDAQLTARWLKQSRTIGHVHLAHDAAAALSLLRERHLRPEPERPQLVLLDLNLHGTSGFVVLQQMKTDTDLARIPVIILSASAFPEDRQRAVALQASLFLNKPGDAAEFVQLVGTLDEFCANHFPPRAPRS